MCNERQAAALPLTSSLLLALFLSGCSSLQPIDPGPGESLVDLVELHDEVEIDTRNDGVLSFVVTGIDGDVIVGNGRAVALADIRGLEIRRRDVPATVGLILVLTTVGLQVIGISAGFVPLGY